MQAHTINSFKFDRMETNIAPKRPFSLFVIPFMSKTAFGADSWWSNKQTWVAMSSFQ